MATLKRTDSKPLKEAPPTPPRECVACCESEQTVLVRPCRDCETDYCAGCLYEMFTEASVDRTRMPPRCCSLLQIHIIADSMGQREIDKYREKFEEWITPAKTFCPAPTCSAFIPERRIPQPPRPASEVVPPLARFLHGILTTVDESPSARFFRGEVDITQLQGYTNVVESPIDLGKIKANVARYDSVNGLTSDIRLLVTNACSFNGVGHPVSKAAGELLTQYLRALSTATQRLLDAPSGPASSSMFACPKCHVAICTTCKQFEHGDTPCDTTTGDEELAMLESFGYKRCPRCKAGVKKMFGCSHMQCICGARWCYWCQRSINECDGACAQREEEDDEEGEYYSDDELEGEEGDHPPPRTVPPAANADPNVPVNLDGGGYARWADGVGDFGDEPEEDGVAQIWSCKHKFEPYRVTKEDGIDRGDYGDMECNRCFTKITPRRPSMSSRRLKSRIKETSALSSFGKWIRAVDMGKAAGEAAWECTRCRVVTCDGCRKKYEGS